MLDERSESDIIEFLNFIETNVDFISEHCAVVLIPLICEYTFPLCDINAKPPDQSLCESVQHDACATEWRIIMTTSFSTLLPVCGALDFDDNALNVDHNDSEMTVNILQCHLQFMEFCGVCLLLCGKFSRYDEDSETKLRQTIIVTAAANCIREILVTLIAILR